MTTQSLIECLAKQFLLLFVALIFFEVFENWFNNTSRCWRLLKYYSLGLSQLVLLVVVVAVVIHFHREMLKSTCDVAIRDIIKLYSPHQHPSSHMEPPSLQWKPND